MSAYDKLYALVDVLGEDKVIHEVACYFSSEELKRFADSVATDWEVDLEDPEDGEQLCTG